MKYYKKYVPKYLTGFIIAISCVLLEAVCDLLQPTIMSKVIDIGVKNNRLDYVLSYSGLMFLIAVIGVIFASTRNIMASKVSQGFGADLRMDLFKKVQHFSITSVDKMETGSIITRLTNDITQVYQFLNGMMRIFLKAPITCIGSIVMAFILSPKLSLILFGSVAIGGVFIAICLRLGYIKFHKVQKALDRVSTVMQEYLLGVRLVKSFGRFDYEENRFEQANNSLAKASTSAQRVIAVFSPFIALSINLGIVFVLYIGGIMLGRGTVEIGKVVAFTNYMTQILMSLMMISNVFNTFVRTRASSDRIVELFEQEEEIDCVDNNKKMDNSGVAFNNVTFSYPDSSGEPTLSDICFACEKGTSLGVIGSTGSGKTTIASLLLRFYDVTKGSITIRGVDIRDIALKELRNIVAITPQRAMLFSGTVKNNILWGNENATVDDVETSLKIANAYDFVNSLPQGHDSILGQQAVNISGGQKQRLSIARAIIRKPEVLIFDDSTSALDSITEANVLKGLFENMEDTTAIIITQRIATAKRTDKILVLDNGTIKGFGSHDELLETCDVYNDIYISQFGKGVSING